MLNITNPRGFLPSGEYAVLSAIDPDNTEGGWQIVYWSSKEDYLADMAERDQNWSDRATVSEAFDTREDALAGFKENQPKYDLPTHDERVAQIKAEILADIADGTMPATVRTFSELHDHVDANGYGGYFEEWEPFDGSEEAIGAINAVQNEVDNWLRRGRRDAEPGRPIPLTLGDFRRLTLHLPDHTAITATTPEGFDSPSEWMHLDLEPHNRPVFDAEGNIVDGPMSIVLGVNPDFHLFDL